MACSIVEPPLPILTYLTTVQGADQIEQDILRASMLRGRHTQPGFPWAWKCRMERLRNLKKGLSQTLTSNKPIADQSEAS